MSLVRCGHICDCDCHGPVLHRQPGPELGKKYLIELPEIVHNGPCCDYLCPAGCGNNILRGMTKAHLMAPQCHGKTEAEADNLIANPPVVSPVVRAVQALIDSPDLARKRFADEFGRESK